MKQTDRALIILTAYDFEALQLTLKSLEHTLDSSEKIVIILNAKDTLASAVVERISRAWALKDPINRFVVRPKCSGAKAFFAIKEVLENYQPLLNVKYICKIDDDVIPLKSKWLIDMHKSIIHLESTNNAAFVTGLINNNSWGFAELLKIFDKYSEYSVMFNYNVDSDIRNRVELRGVDNGSFGTIWQEPYLAWWVHQWTTLNLMEYVNKTENLQEKQISFEIGYSIGCIIFNRNMWLELDPETSASLVDEEMIFHYCSQTDKSKWALLNIPFIHLFYFNQRIPNRDLIPEIATSLADYFKDESFENIRRVDLQELIINVAESVKKQNQDFEGFVSALASNNDY